MQSDQQRYQQHQKRTVEMVRNLHGADRRRIKRWVNRTLQNLRNPHGRSVSGPRPVCAARDRRKFHRMAARVFA